MLTLYAWLGCLTVLGIMPRTSRVVAIWIILVAGVVTMAIGRRKWMNLRSKNEAVDVVWSFVWTFCTATTMQCLDEWLRFPSYVKSIVFGVSVIGIVFILVIVKRRKRIADV